MIEPLLPVLRGEQERVRDFCFSESDFTEERIDGVSITSTPYWRGADGCRSNAWQTIITENSKYIKYLGYKLGKQYEKKIEHFGCKPTYMPEDPMIV